MNSATADAGADAGVSSATCHHHDHDHDHRFFPEKINLFCFFFKAQLFCSLSLPLSLFISGKLKIKSLLKNDQILLITVTTPFYSAHRNQYFT